MGSLARKAIGGSIHKIREFELEKVSLAEEFDILQIVGEGWFGKILLVEHKATDTEMVLKALPKPYTALRDFYREFHYGLHLGAHRNIITTYDVAFETAGFYVFSQEYAPLGDLTSNVSETGIGELHTKRVARQLAAALEHLHGRDLVHRDVKLDNILVFKSDFSRVKLCDFGETRRSGSVVRRHNEWLPYAPPEVLKTVNDDTYKAETSHDVWQFAIVVFVCLTGCLPWQKAAMDDPRYTRYVSWHYSPMPIRKQPKLFKLVSSKAQRLFRKFLEPRVDKRPVTLTDVHKYLDDRWLAKNSSEKNNGLSTADDGLCPSMYSYHSSPEEKNKLLHSLTQYGIETTVDRVAKKDRIRAWIESSVIEEEEEEEAEEDSEDEERVGIMDNETGPMGERMNRGPIEDKRQQVVKDSARLERQKRRERRFSTLNKPTSEVYTPPIDPRIPLEQQRFTRSVMNLNMNCDFSLDANESYTRDDSGVIYSDRRNSPPVVMAGNVQQQVQSFKSPTVIDRRNSPPAVMSGNVQQIQSYKSPTVIDRCNSPPAVMCGNVQQIQSYKSPTVIDRCNSPPEVSSENIQQPLPFKNFTTIDNNTQKDVSPSKQNGNVKVVEQRPHKTAEHHPQPVIKADLVENRGKNKVNGKFDKILKSPSFKKKPLKERFEAYGSFEEKSTTSSMSNSTGRSTSK